MAFTSADATLLSSSIPTNLFDASRPNPWLDDPLPQDAGRSPPYYNCRLKSFEHHDLVQDHWNNYPYRLQSTNLLNIPYYEFRAQGSPLDNIGHPGDVWIDVYGHGICAVGLWAHDAQGWVAWPGRYAYHLVPHPHLHDRYMWCRNEDGVVWCTREQLMNGRNDLGDTMGAREAILSFLEVERQGRVASDGLHREQEGTRSSDDIAEANDTAQVKPENAVGGHSTNDHRPVRPSRTPFPVENRCMVVISTPRPSKSRSPLRRRKTPHPDVPDPDVGSDSEPVRMPRKRMRTRAPSSASEVKFDKSLVEEIDTSAMSRFRRLENDNQRLVDALGESEEQVGKYRDKSKHLAQRVKTLTDAQDTSQRLLDEEREQLADHRDRIDSLVTENQRLSEVNRDLVNERDRLAGGSGGSKPESLDCKPRSPTKVEKQGVEDSVDVELPSLDSGPSLPEPIQKAFEYFNEYMDGASKMRSEAQRNVAEMKQRLEEAEAKLHAKYEEVSRVNAEMELTRRALTDATLRLAEREETLVKAMERSQKADEEIATVKASLSRTEDGLENANQTIAIVTQEATKSHQQLDTINSMLTAAEQERAELGQRLVSTEGNLFDARQECQSLVSKLDEEREGRGRAERRITELQSAIRELPNTLQALLS